MEVFEGFFIDRSSSPRVPVTVRGSWTSAEFVSVLDTGFEGMIALPIPQAMPIGLTINGEFSSVLANGAEVKDLTAKVTD